MKKLLLFFAIAMIGVVASAADQTKEQFIAARKATLEKAGKEFTKAVEANAGRMFDRLDLNKDGKLSDEEQRPQKPRPKPAQE